MYNDEISSERSIILFFVQLFVVTLYIVVTGFEVFGRYMCYVTIFICKLCWNNSDKSFLSKSVSHVFGRKKL